jgi:hypothetical protein
VSDMPKIEANEDAAALRVARAAPGPSERTSGKDAEPRGGFDDGGSEHRTKIFFSALAAVALAASLGRLALPFTTAEAGFVHQAMRALALVEGPDFAPVGSLREAGILARAFFETGLTERAARLLFVLSLAAAGLLALTAAKAVRASSAFAVALLLLGAPALLRADVVSPGLLYAAPAACALLAVARGGRGFAVVATLSSGAALFATARLDPGTAATTAIGVLTLAVSGGSPAAVARALAAIGLAAGAVRLDGAPTFAAAAVFAMVLRVVAASTLLADGQRPRPDRVAGALLPLAALLVARTAEAGGAASRALLVFGLLVAYAATFAAGVAPREDPRILLEDARRVATTADVVAFGGEGRVGAAVYARLGHDPAMPHVFVPEGVAKADLPAAARRFGARVLWTDLDLDETAGLDLRPPDPARGEPESALLRRYVVDEP